MYQQNYGYYPQQQQQPQPTRPQYINFLKGRPVSSLEEVRAMSIDFDGSISYFPDIANHKIYTKQINLDGTSTVSMYELKEIPNQEPSTTNYVTREEFDYALSQIKEILNKTADGTLEETTVPAAAPKDPAPQFKF